MRKCILLLLTALITSSKLFAAATEQEFKNLISPGEGKWDKNTCFIVEKSSNPYQYGWISSAILGKQSYGFMSGFIINLYTYSLSFSEIESITFKAAIDSTTTTLDTDSKLFGIQLWTVDDMSGSTAYVKFADMKNAGDTPIIDTGAVYSLNDISTGIDAILSAEEMADLGDLGNYSNLFINICLYDNTITDFVKFNNLSGELIINNKAVPEPATYAVIFGIFALGFAAWRKRR